MEDYLLIIIIVLIVMGLYLIKYLLKKAVLSNSNGQENWDNFTESFKASTVLIFAFIIGIFSEIFKALFSKKK